MGIGASPLNPSYELPVGEGWSVACASVSLLANK